MSWENYQEFRKKELEHAKIHDYGFGYLKHAVFEAAIFCVYYLRKTFVTANMLTTLNFILWLALPVLFWYGSFRLAILSVVLMIAVNFLDFMDGILARAKKTQSRGGGYFDSFVHAVTLPVICTSFGYYSYLQTGALSDIFLGLVIGLWYLYYFLVESMAVFVLVHSKKPVKYKMEDLSVKTVEREFNFIELAKKIISRIYGPPEIFWIFLLVLLLSLISSVIIQVYLYTAAAIALLSIFYKFYKNWSYLKGFR